MGSTWSLPAGTSSTARPERSSTRFTMKPAPSYKAKRSSKSSSRVASRFAVTINSELVRNASKDCSSPGTPPFLQGNPQARRCVLETRGTEEKAKRNMQKSMTKAACIATLTLMISGYGTAADHADAKDAAFFEERVTPILCGHCTSCHNEQI